MGKDHVDDFECKDRVTCMCTHIGNKCTTGCVTLLVPFISFKFFHSVNDGGEQVFIPDSFFVISDDMTRLFNFFSAEKRFYQLFFLS